MRYYDLRVIDPKSGKTTFQAGSYPGGSYDPGALNISFDLPVAPQGTPLGQSGARIRVDGVPQSVLTNAQNLYGQQIELRGGMGLGLPLTNPAQAGLLVQGSILQVFGNWVSVNLDLDFVLTGSIYTLANPGNIVLHWTAGTPLATALTNTLKAAYPSATIKMNIGNIVMPNDEVGVYQTIGQLASILSEITASSVQIVINGDSITVYDSTYKPSPTMLNFNDFIGQPMWIGSNIIQIWTVLRADLSVGDVIKMPVGFQNLPSFVQTQAASQPSQNKYQSAMQGKFIVQALRHIGDLRMADGRSWCSIINASVAT